MNDPIRQIDPSAVKQGVFKHQVADCIVLTRDGKILMQQRPANWGASAGCLTAFGGHMEPGETPAQTVMRELNEELGAQIAPDDLVSLGALTEAMTNHTEVVHTYFWHDKKGSITGCYECEAAYYDRIEGALAHPKIMDYARWMLTECKKRNLLRA